MKMESAWIQRVLNLHILEAKGLAENSHNFCTIRVDDQDWDQSITKTYVSSKSKAMHLRESFTFCQSTDFHKLKITLWSGDSAGQERPCGVISLSKARILSDLSDWFLFQPLVFAPALGDVYATLRFIPSDGSSSSGQLSVSIEKARHLGTNTDLPPSSYVTVHLSNSLKSFQTSSIKNTSDPFFDEVFTFDVDSLSDTAKIYVSVWNEDAMNANPAQGSLGFFSFTIKDIMGRGGEWDSWFRLDAYETSSQKPVRAELYSDLIKYEHSEKFLASFPQKHTLFESPVTVNHCQLCSEGTRGQRTLECTTCGVNLHTSCIFKLEPDCSMLGAIKIKAQCKEILVLSSVDYEPLLAVLQQNDFSVPLLIGSSLTQSEDAVQTLLPIFEALGLAVEYLQALIKHEVSNSEDTHSLFRANSLASKAWDSYVRIHGKGFLQSVWKPVIANIIENDLTFELDPSRLQDSYEAGLHAANLEESCEQVLKSLMQNLHQLPLQFQDILAVMRKSVQEKFPDCPDAAYTSVGNFLFLRFLIPVLLSPNSFDLLEDELDVSTRHRLLLVGKILQNLANFVEFGQKQPHLTAMNTFLKNNKFRMEILVELISSKSSEKKRVLGQGEIDKNRTAQLCAAMVHHLDQQSAIDGAWMLQSKGRDLARVLDLIHLKMGQACKSLHFVGLKKDLIKRSESVGSQMSVSQNIPRTTSPEPIVRSGSPAMKALSSSLANLPFKKAQVQFVQTLLTSDSIPASPPATPKKRFGVPPALAVLSLQESPSAPSLKSPKLLTAFTGLFGRSKTPPPSSCKSAPFTSFSQQSTSSFDIPVRASSASPKIESTVSLTSTLSRTSPLAHPDSPIPQISHDNPFAGVSLSSPVIRPSQSTIPRVSLSSSALLPSPSATLGVSLSSPVLLPSLSATPEISLSSPALLPSPSTTPIVKFDLSSFTLPELDLTWESNNENLLEFNASS